MNKWKKLSSEVRERAVWMVQEHRGKHLSSVGGRRADRAEYWLRTADVAGVVKRAEVDAGARPDITTTETKRTKELEREKE